MQIIHDQNLKLTDHGVLVQAHSAVRWAAPEEALGTVYLASSQAAIPTLDEFVRWVDSVEGQWVSDSDIAGI